MCINFKRLEWLMLTLLSVNSLSAVDQASCPCMPIHLCSEKVSLEEQTACDEPGLVNCCGTQNDDNAEMQKIIEEHLTEEKKIMSALDSLLGSVDDNIQTHNSEDGHREDKSYSTSTNTKNNLGDDEKQIKDPLENPSIGLRDTIDDVKTVESDTTEQNKSKPLNQIQNTTASEEVFIVYAKKPNKNNADFNEDKVSPHIVLPSKDIFTENEQHNTENEAEESSPIESWMRIDTEQTSNSGQSNTQRIFPKQQSLRHLSSLKPLQKNSNNKIEDSEIASSEFHDIREERDTSIEKLSMPRSSILSPIHVPNISTEQINNNKLPFRSPPRRLIPRPGAMKKEENRQMSKNVLELLKEQSKGRMGLKSIRTSEGTAQNTNLNNEAIMSNLNLRTINSIMKTNFSERSSDLRKSIPVSKYNRVSSKLSMGLIDKTQQEQVIDDERGSSLNDRAGNKVPQRGRLRSRVQPTKYISTDSTSQDDATMDTSKLQESLKRLQSNRRLRVKPQVNSLGQGNETSTTQIYDNSNTNEQNVQVQLNPTRTVTSSYSSRRSRPRMKINTKSSSTVSSSEDIKLTQITDTKTTTQPSTSEARFTDSIPTEDVNRSSEKSEGDLESSGSDHDPQQFSFQARFQPPERMESGFEPILNGRNLQIVGPVPKTDGQSNFDQNADEIGLQLPFPESQVQFNPRSMITNNRMIPKQFLLAPVVTTPQPPIFISNIKKSELLPPVEVPPTVSSELTESNKPPDFTKLHSELNSLKSRYEILLDNYARALSIYNENFKQFFSELETM